MTASVVAKAPATPEPPASTGLGRADGVRASGAGRGSAKALTPLATPRRTQLAVGGIAVAAGATALAVSPALRGAVAREALPVLKMTGKVALAGAVATLVTVGFLALVGDDLTKPRAKPVATPAGGKVPHATK
jgi:hypothetical protein